MSASSLSYNAINAACEPVQALKLTDKRLYACIPDGFLKNKIPVPT